MAEAITNAFAKRQGIAVRAVSAGTIGGKELNPTAVVAMEELGISMAGQSPKIMTEEMVAQADKIISMGCGVDAAACPARFILTEDWGLDDPAGQPIERVRLIRDEIQNHVKALLLEIATKR